MVIVIIPRGRGNWKRVELSIAQPADLFPAVRDQQVRVGDQWHVAGRMWRIVEIRP